MGFFSQFFEQRGHSEAAAEIRRCHGLSPSSKYLTPPQREFALLLENLVGLPGEMWRHCKKGQELLHPIYVRIDEHTPHVEDRRLTSHFTFIVAGRDYSRGDYYSDHNYSHSLMRGIGSYRDYPDFDSQLVKTLGLLASKTYRYGMRADSKDLPEPESNKKPDLSIAEAIALLRDFHKRR